MQNQNKINSSMFLWLNNLICQRGSGFNNAGSNFYQMPSMYNGLYTYGSPFSQFISDSSVSGAIVPTGIYLNNTFVGTGQSGFFGFNYERGIAYFTSPVSSNVNISGAFSVKDFNVRLTDETEINLLFENRLSLRPKSFSNFTGQNPVELSYPIVFIRNSDIKNEPFSFGGTELTKMGYTFYIFADSKYQLDAMEGLLIDSVRDYIPLIDNTNSPYDSYGRVKNAPFNYQSIKNARPAGSPQSIYIEDVDKAKYKALLYNEIQKVNPEAFFSSINMTVSFVKR